MWGCSDLARRLLVVKPTVSVCGHVHEGHGVLEEDGILYVNAAICDRANYDPVQAPIVVDIYDVEGRGRVALVVQGD